MTTTSDLITDLFCQVDDRMRGIPKHPKTRLCVVCLISWIQALFW
jgi:hypothetical protein